MTALSLRAISTPLSDNNAIFCSVETRQGGKSIVITAVFEQLHTCQRAMKPEDGEGKNRRGLSYSVRVQYFRRYTPIMKRTYEA